MSRQPPAIGRCDPTAPTQTTATMPDLFGRDAGYRNQGAHHPSVRKLRYVHYR